METASTKRFSIWQNLFLYGVIAAVLFIAWFLIGKLTGLIYSMNLHYLNFPILFIVTYLCLNKIYKARDFKVNYITGLGVCMAVAGFSVLIFGTFLFVYLRYLDPAFMVYLQQNAPFGWTMLPIRAAFWTGHELFGFQVVYAIIIMEYFKFQQYKKRAFANINIATFTKIPRMRISGLVLLILGMIAVGWTLFLFFYSQTYPHPAGLIKINENNFYSINWVPIVGAVLIGLGIISISNYYRRKTDAAQKL